jgi:hypothetical protein
MYAFYGCHDIAYFRFADKIGSQRVIDQLVDKMSPRATRAIDFFVFGDGSLNEWQCCMRGNPPAVCGKLARALKKKLPLGHLVYGDEYNSSQVDSVRGNLMFHPPQGEVTAINGRKFLKRIYIIYQSSLTGYTCTWNRDGNASINIWKNYKHQCEHDGEMPVGFQRGIDLPVPAALGYQYTERRNPIDGRKCFNRTTQLAA